MCRMHRRRPYASWLTSQQMGCRIVWPPGLGNRERGRAHYINHWLDLETFQYLFKQRIWSNIVYNWVWGLKNEHLVILVESMGFWYERDNWDQWVTLFSHATSIKWALWLIKQSERCLEYYKTNAIDLSPLGQSHRHSQSWPTRFFAEHRDLHENHTERIKMTSQLQTTFTFITPISPLSSINLLLCNHIGYFHNYGSN